MNIRKAQLRDVDEIVSIHIERFPNFFLTSLGPSFLFAFYKAFLKSPAVLLVLEDDDELKGFAAGSLTNNNFFKKLLINNLIGFSISGLKLLFNNPASLKRIAFNAGKSESIDIEFSELLSIATLKNKKGYGKILLQQFEDEIKLLSLSELPISLTTDFYDNEKTVQFYVDSGYSIMNTFTSYGNRKMYRLIKNI